MTVGASQQKPTVFDHITESMETLAEKLVYEAITCDSDGHVLSGYRSTLTNGFWINKTEAIAATVEELKKEFKEFKEDKESEV